MLGRSGLTGAILTCTHTHTPLYSTKVPGKACQVRVEKASYVEMVLSKKVYFQFHNRLILTGSSVLWGTDFWKLFFLVKTHLSKNNPLKHREKSVLLGKIIFSDKGTRHLLCHKTKVTSLAFSIIYGSPTTYYFNHSRVFFFSL